MKLAFKRAREYAPSIIFIDEIDAIGYRNGSHLDIAINQFLTEINGFSDNPEEMIFIIAATNLPEKIDPAIKRSGRIDLHIEISKLDRDARKYFIDKLLKKPKSGQFDMDKLLTYSAGMNGADLEKVDRESSLYLFRNNLKKLTEEILIEQINTIKYGEKLTIKNVDTHLAATAIHEAGHAIASLALLPDKIIEQVGIIPRKNALGFISYDQDQNNLESTCDDIKKNLIIAFAGRTAEIKKFNGSKGITSGASSDLQNATNYAYHAIAELGMDDSVGYVNISGLKSNYGINLFEEDINQAVKKWLNEAKNQCEKLVDLHWNKIENLANLLLKQEVVTAVELKQIFKEKK